MTAVRRAERRACEDQRMAEKDLRNPFQSEQDAFRILVMIIAAAVIVIGSAILVSKTLGAVLAVIAVGFGLWRAGDWLRQMLAAPDDEDPPSR